MSPRPASRVAVVLERRTIPPGPVVRAVQECQQAVLWNGTVGMTLVDHEPAEGLAVVPLIDMPPSRVVVAWKDGDTNPLVRSFVQIAITAYHDRTPHRRDIPAPHEPPLA